MKSAELIRKLQSKEFSPVDHTHKVIDEVRRINKDYGYFNTISDELAIEQAKYLTKDEKKEQKRNEKKSQGKLGKLFGVPISVKDAICVKDVESTAGSKILKGYLPTFNATCIQRAIDEGAIIIGKTAQDEFGFGTFSTNVGIGFKIPKNPFDKERSCGGSSGGCAGISQKISSAHISLGESTGGSIVTPASFCGVYGLCPTYSRVSRYGLIDYGNSLDKIGPMGKYLEDVALLLEVISGADDKDSTCSQKPIQQYTDFLKKDAKGMKIGVIKNAFAEGTQKEVEKSVWKGIEQLEKAGAEYKEINLKLPIKYGVQAYYLISASEASTNLAKYCGMRYGAHDKLEGSFNEYFTKVRSANLGEEAKRRIMLGTFARMAGYRDAYYMKVLKVRTKIIEEYKKHFKNFDALISPTVAVLPPKFSDIEKLTPLECYMMDTLTVGPNLAGLPHLNVPCGASKGLPVGALLIADHFNEGKLIQLGKEIR
ncbi:MAG: aspartyl/glutamyl-tRNA amidotransferase subunit A [Nanoarchaeota archaeon]|nr:aspartyl/glutamyl-tRNA amidotransferase subunit A [Nanoarchaeota archaeon]